MTQRIGRRRLLCFAASAAAGFAGAAAATRARALSLEPMPEAMKSSYLAACEAPSLHLRLLAEIDAKLAGRELTAAQIAAVRAESRCPLCGCPLVAAEAPGSLAAPEAGGTGN
jgi:hypothetical protein